MQRPPVDTFIVYSAKDELYFKELRVHLAPLEQRGLIRNTYERRVAPDDYWQRQIDKRIEQAYLVLLLVSPDFAASDYAHEQEFDLALKRCGAGKACVIPIQVRVCGAPIEPIAKLQALPDDGRHIKSFPDRDEAWVGVVQALMKIIESATPAGGEDVRAPPMARIHPHYIDDKTRRLSTDLGEAFERKERLVRAGASTKEVDEELRSLRRQLREGGQLRAGDRLGEGRYLLLEEVGRGGFAQVWLTVDQTTGGSVAIKVLHPNLAGDPVRRERFFRGARVMTSLEQYGVVRVIEPRGHDGGFHYFVMEFIPRKDFRKLVLDKSIGRDEVLAFILAVADTLAEAHRRGIAHRDVKPSNILVDDTGAPLLTDFDLVACAETTGGTRTGAMGTFLYAAPEIMDRPQDASAPADVYGLAMTAVFGIYGAELPVTAMLEKVRFLDALPCGDRVRRVLRRALDHDPEARYPDASALREALSKARLADAAPDPTHTTPEPAQVLAGAPATDEQTTSDAPTRPANVTVEPKIDWSNKDLRKHRLTGRNLRNAVLDGAKMMGMSLLRADLTGASLRGANLLGADLSRVSLEGADLSAAHLSHAKLLGAKLRGAKLVGARLRGAALVGADIDPGALDGCDTFGTALPGATDIQTTLASTSACNAIAVSSTDFLAVMGREDGSILLWDLRVRSALRSISGHAGPVHCVAWSPDGRTIASGSADGTARLWEVETGAERRLLAEFLRGVKSLAWSPDGKLIALGCDDGAIRIGPVEGDVSPRVLLGHAARVNSVAWSPDGQTIASGSEDGQIFLFNAESGNVDGILVGHAGPIQSVAWSLDGALLASGSDDATVKLWERTTGAVKSTLLGHAQRVWSVSFSGNGAVLASGSDDQTIRLWDVTSGASPRVLSGNGSAVRSLAFTPMGLILVSGSTTGSGRVWDAESGRVRGNLEGYTDSVSSVAFSADGKTLAGGSNAVVWLCDATTAVEQHILAGHTGYVRGIAWNPNGSTLATICDDTIIRLWQATTGAMKREIPTSVIPQTIAWSPDGETLAGGGHDRSILIWEAATGEEHEVTPSSPIEPRAVAWSSDGRRLAATCNDGSLEIWTVASGLYRRAPSGAREATTTVAWSPNGETVAAGFQDGSVAFWKGPEMTLHKSAFAHGRGVLRVAFSPNSAILASASMDRAVCLWDVASSSVLHTLRGHTSDVVSVAFSPDSAVLASGSYDGTMRLFNTATGACLAIFAVSTMQEWIAVTPDGTYKANPGAVEMLWQMIGLCRFEPGELDHLLPAPLRIPRTSPLFAWPQ